MFENLPFVPDLSQVTAADIGMYGVGLGVLVAVFGVAAALSPRDRVLRRMAAQGARARDGGFEAGILRPMSAAPRGLMKSLIPADEKERTQVQRQLALAGRHGAHPVRNYYLLRLGLGIVLPLLLLSTIAAA